MSDDALDIMECMATSDNVIRAGLTPKLRDIPTLISGLTYDVSDPQKHVVQPQEFGSSPISTTTLYDPPVPEFSVVQVELSEGKEDRHEAIQGPSIFVVTEGSGLISWMQNEIKVTLGDVFFIGSGTETSFMADHRLQLFRAFVQ